MFQANWFWRRSLSCCCFFAVVVVVAIFSNSGHLGFLTWPYFTILKPRSLIMLHVEFDNMWCNCFRDKIVWSCLNIFFSDRCFSILQVLLDKKFILLFLLFWVTRPSWIFYLTQFYNSKIWQQLVQGFKRKSCLKLFKSVIFDTVIRATFSQKYPVVLKKQFIFLFLLFLLTAAILDIQHMFHWYSMPKFSPKYPMVLEKKFIFFAIFSNSGHLGYSTWPNFTILRPRVRSCSTWNFRTVSPVVS